MKENLQKINEIKNLAKKMIFEAQNFIRYCYDISSVSFRDIKRYNILYEFFFDYLLFFI